MAMTFMTRRLTYLVLPIVSIYMDATVGPGVAYYRSGFWLAVGHPAVQDSLVV